MEHGGRMRTNPLVRRSTRWSSKAAILTELHDRYLRSMRWSARAPIASPISTATTTRIASATRVPQSPPPALGDRLYSANAKEQFAAAA
jgi:hypothetical protein